VASFTQAADGVYAVDSSDLDFDQTVDAVLGVVHAAVSRPAGA
jgi:cytidylate kinase